MEKDCIPTSVFRMGKAHRLHSGVSNMQVVLDLDQAPESGTRHLSGTKVSRRNPIEGFTTVEE